MNPFRLFVQQSPRPQFVVDYFLPEGTDITQTQSELVEIADHIRTLDNVTGTNTMVGGGHQRFMLTYAAEDGSSAYGQILVDVDDYRNIERLRPEIQSWIGENYLASNTKVWKFVLGPGGGSTIEARFFGSDPSVLRGLSDQAKVIYADAGSVAIKDDWREQVKVMRPIINTQNARRLGLTQGEISNAIYSHLNGANIGVYREDEELRNIVMRPFEVDRNDIAGLRDIQVFSQIAGGYIPIAQVVDRFELVFESGYLRRIDRQLAIAAQADNAPGVLSGDLFGPCAHPLRPLPCRPVIKWSGRVNSETVPRPMQALPPPCQSALER